MHHTDDARAAAADFLAVPHARLRSMPYPVFDGWVLRCSGLPGDGAVVVVDTDGTVTGYPPLPPAVVVGRHRARRAVTGRR